MKSIFSSLLIALVMTGFAVAGTAIEYKIDDGLFEGYMAVADADADAPMVLLVHDWDGLTDYEVKRADMLLDEGYSVFCADLFGKGVRPTSTEDKRKCTSMLDADRPRMRQLMEGALNAAAARGLHVDHCVAMGYCFGGTAILEYARSGADLKGWATFHGGLALPEDQGYSKVRGQMLIQHGSADTGVTIAQFAALIRDLEAAGVPHECISYGGAPHAWTVFGSDRYRKEADGKSWKRLLEFLENVLK